MSKKPVWAFRKKMDQIKHQNKEEWVSGLTRPSGLTERATDRPEDLGMDIRDSRGRPISLPEVSILKRRPA